MISKAESVTSTQGNYIHFKPKFWRNFSIDSNFHGLNRYTRIDTKSSPCLGGGAQEQISQWFRRGTFCASNRACTSFVSSRVSVNRSWVKLPIFVKWTYLFKTLTLYRTLSFHFGQWIKFSFKFWTSKLRKPISLLILIKILDLSTTAKFENCDMK